MYYWLKKLLEPTFLDTLCEIKGNVEAVLEFDRTWKFVIPNKLVKKLTFENCQTLINKTADDWRQRSVLISRAIELAQTYKDYSFVLEAAFVGGLRPTLVQACLGMMKTAETIDECLRVLNFSRDKRIRLNSREVPNEFIEKCLDLAITPNEFEEIANDMSEPWYNIAMLGCVAAHNSLDTVGCNVRLFKRNPDTDNRYLLSEALTLHGSVKDYLELALLIDYEPQLQLQAIEQAKRRVEAPLALKGIYSMI